MNLPAYLATPETRRRFRAEVADPPLHILIDAGGRVLAMARGDERHHRPDRRGRPPSPRGARSGRRDAIRDVDAPPSLIDRLRPRAMHPCQALADVID